MNKNDGVVLNGSERIQILEKNKASSESNSTLKLIKPGTNKMQKSIEV